MGVVGERKGWLSCGGGVQWTWVAETRETAGVLLCGGAERSTEACEGRGEERRECGIVRWKGDSPVSQELLQLVWPDQGVGVDMWLRNP